MGYLLLAQPACGTLYKDKKQQQTVPISQTMCPDVKLHNAEFHSDHKLFGWIV